MSLMEKKENQYVYVCMYVCEDKKTNLEVMGKKAFPPCFLLLNLHERSAYSDNILEDKRIDTEHAIPQF